MGSIWCLVRRRSYTCPHAALQQLEFHHFIPEIKEVFEEHRTQAKVHVHASHLLYAFGAHPPSFESVRNGKRKYPSSRERVSRKKNSGNNKRPFLRNPERPLMQVWAALRRRLDRARAQNLDSCQGNAMNSVEESR